jgi:uncharacterized repeat protein (TIGR02543 family)
VSDVTVPTIPQNYTVESDDIEIGTASKLGYTFTGWLVNGETPAVADYTITKGSTGALTFTPVLQNKNYSITFDYGDGALPTGTTNPTGRWVNSAANTINNPVLKGSTFTGWAIKITDDEGKETTETWTWTEDEPNYVIPTGTAASYEFTAVYTPDSYNIDIYVSGVVGVSPTEAYVTDTYTLAGVTAKAKNVQELIPSFDGYTITGIVLSMGTETVNYNPNDSIVIDAGCTMADRKYTVTYSAGTYRLAFQNDNGVDVWADPVAVGTSLAELPNGPIPYGWVQDGYQFKTWVLQGHPELGDVEYNAEQILDLTMPAEAVTFRGTVEAISYTLTLEVPEGTTIDGYNADTTGTKLTKSISADDTAGGNVIMLPTAAEIHNDGITFSKWTINDVEATQIEDVTGNVTAVLVFELNKYPIAFYDRYNGTDTLLKTVADVEYGISIYDGNIAPTYVEVIDLHDESAYLYGEAPVEGQEDIRDMWVLADGTVVDPEAKVTGAQSYYLNWHEYASVIYKDGDTVVKTVTRLKTTDKLLKDAPDTLSKEGYKLFWADKDKNHVTDADLVTEVSATLTADWVLLEDVKVVTFDPDNGDPQWTVEVAKGTTVKEPANNPERTEFLTFDCWCTKDEDGKLNWFDFNTPIDVNTVLIAKWTLDPEVVQAFFGRTASLNENINLNAKLGLTPETEAAGVTSDMFYVKYIVEDAGGEMVPHEAPAFVPDPANTTDTLNVYTTTTEQFFSYQMWKPIIIQFFFDDGGTPVLIKQFGSTEAPYSLQQYFEKQYSQDAEIRDLMKSVLDYGANAQIYFKDRYNTNYTGEGDEANLVNYNVNPINEINVDKPTNVSGKSGSVAEVQRIGAALKLDGDIKISVKLQADSLAGLKFSVPVGYKYEVDETPSGGVYTVYVSGIKSNMLGNDMKFTVTGTNGEGAPSQLVYTYSPFTYAAKYGWNGTDDALAVLCKAIVEYGNAASDYFGPRA